MCGASNFDCVVVANRAKGLTHVYGLGDSHLKLTVLPQNWDWIARADAQSTLTQDLNNKIENVEMVISRMCSRPLFGVADDNDFLTDSSTGSVFPEPLASIDLGFL